MWITPTLEFYTDEKSLKKLYTNICTLLVYCIRSSNCVSICVSCLHTQRLLLNMRSYMGECINVYNRIVVSCIEVIFACVSMYVCYESEEEIINSIFLRSSFFKAKNSIWKEFIYSNIIRTLCRCSLWNFLHLKSLVRVL